MSKPTILAVALFSVLLSLASTAWANPSQAQTSSRASIYGDKTWGQSRDELYERVRAQPEMERAMLPFMVQAILTKNDDLITTDSPKAALDAMKIRATEASLMAGIAREAGQVNVASSFNEYAKILSAVIRGEKRATYRADLTAWGQRFDSLAANVKQKYRTHLQDQPTGSYLKLQSDLVGFVGTFARWSVWDKDASRPGSG